MAETTVKDASTGSAEEKAYAAAAEALPLKAAPEAAKPVAAAKPAAAPAPVKAAPAAKVKKPAKTAKAPAKVAKPAPVKAPAKAAAKPVTYAKTAAKVAKPAKLAVKRKAPALKFKIKPTIIPSKEKAMNATTKIAEELKSAVNEAQEKAKTAFAKGKVALDGYTEFTKGNASAVVESGKILAAGLQKMGSTIATDTKATAETFASEVKDFASAKTPAEMLQLQSEMFHRQFDRAVAYNSKASEAMLKLANDAIAPIAGRLSLAMDKIRKAA